MPGELVELLRSTGHQVTISDNLASSIAHVDIDILLVFKKAICVSTRG